MSRGLYFYKDFASDTNYLMSKSLFVFKDLAINTTYLVLCEPDMHGNYHVTLHIGEETKRIRITKAAGEALLQFLKKDKE